MAIRLPDRPNVYPNWAADALTCLEVEPNFKPLCAEGCCGTLHYRVVEAEVALRLSISLNLAAVGITLGPPTAIDRVWASFSLVNVGSVRRFHQQEPSVDWLEFSESSDPHARSNFTDMVVVSRRPSLRVSIGDAQLITQSH